MSFASEVLADSPIIYWRFEETAGQHQDETANNHDSTSVTVAGQGTADPDTGWAGVGKGDDFNGTSNFIATTAHVDYFPGATGLFSVEFVAETDTTDTTFRRVCGYETASEGWNFSCVDASIANEDGWRFQRLSAGAGHFIGMGSIPTAGQTYHVVGTYDGADLRVYVNGALVGGPTTTGGASMTDPAAPLEFGRRSFDATRFFDGRIFEFAFYKGTALSLARIQAHYDARNDTGAPPITDGPKLMVARSNLRIA